ncbi:unnamed protein product [Clonostachys rosea]|uniref:Uncharacterized protein n=1 Tax=Bionectria ochroleuca TaxID=29856 RepID=A0ABY6V2T5_BIOOC|nr:unnamed protein product [Clonostachys rosea]
MASVIFKTWERRHQNIHETLQELKSRDPERQIIFFEDLACMGLIAYRYGKQLPEGFKALPKSTGLTPFPVMWQSGYRIHAVKWTAAVGHVVWNSPIHNRKTPHRE